MFNIFCRIDTIDCAIQYCISLMDSVFRFCIIFDQFYCSQCPLIGNGKFQRIAALSCPGIGALLPHIAIWCCVLPNAVCIGIFFKLLLGFFYRKGSFPIFICGDYANPCSVFKNVHHTALKTYFCLPVCLIDLEHDFTFRRHFHRIFPFEQFRLILQPSNLSIRVIRMIDVIRLRSVPCLLIIVPHIGSHLVCCLRGTDIEHGNSPCHHLLHRQCRAALIQPDGDLYAHIIFCAHRYLCDQISKTIVSDLILPFACLIDITCSGRFSRLETECRLPSQRQLENLSMTGSIVSGVADNQFRQCFLRRLCQCFQTAAFLLKCLQIFFFQTFKYCSTEKFIRTHPSIQNLQTLLQILPQIHLFRNIRRNTDQKFRQVPLIIIQTIPPGLIL